MNLKEGKQMTQAPPANYCAGCLNRLVATGPCAACSWNDAKEPQAHSQLPRHYLLVDRYYIGRVLGQGGFGITYIGRDLRLNRLVAIKEYLPVDECRRSGDRITVVTDPGEKKELFRRGLKRFLSEAQSVAQLGTHPNIVTISDHIEANGTAYIIMEFIDGVTLKALLASHGGKLSPKHATSILLHAMAGLRKVHENQMLHRDISPDNIMVSRHGPVKLIDFGAARIMLGEASRSLYVILKRGYAPEEQYRVNDKQGPWTDVYASAATLYKCITGEVPPDALERLNGSAQLKRPSSLADGLSPALEATLLKGLAVKAEDRFRSVEEFTQALLKAQVPSPPPPPSPPDARPPKRAETDAKPMPVVIPTHATAPPGLHWFAVFVLSVFSLGAFPLIWVFVQSGFIRSIHKETRSRLFFAIYASLALLAFFLFFAGCLSAIRMDWKSAEPVVIALIGTWLTLNLIALVFFYIGVYAMRRSMLIYYNTTLSIGLRLSAGMTFFFSILYIQYHLSRINTYMHTGYLSD